MIAFKLAVWMVRAVSLLVPTAVRRRWLAEWFAELSHERDHLRASRNPRMAGLLLVRGALGAYSDARTLHRLDKAEHPRPRLLRRIGEGGVGVGRELRSALRGLRRNLGFSSVAVLTLAIGIGADTAIFSVVNGVLLEPLPYPHADRLVSVGHRAPGLGSSGRWGISIANHFYYREKVRAFEELGTYHAMPAAVTGVGDAELIHGVLATSSLLEILGARAAAGRVFAPADDEPGGPAIAILGHELWVRKYGADPRIVGGTIDVNGYPREIVGVMAAGVHLPQWKVDVWVPLRPDRSATPNNAHTYMAIARLNETTSVAEAQAELNRHVERFPELFPTAYSTAFMEGAKFTAELRSLREDIVGDVSAVLWIVLGSVSLVLLIACANVANLFFVRNEGRRREVALREAIGAGRGDLARYFLLESLVLALLGGVLGVALAYGSLHGLLAMAPASLPRLEEVSVDGSTLMFASAVSVTAGIAFGILPLIRFGRGMSLVALKDGGRGIQSGHGTYGGRNLLVVAEVGMALLLLVAAGLMLRTFRALRSVDPGFAPRGAVAFNISLPAGRYPDHDVVYAFHRQLLERVEALPDVERAGAVVNGIPMEERIGCFAFFVRDRTADAGTTPCVPIRFAAPGFFAAMGIPLVAGRGFMVRDHDSGTGAVVLSQVLAEQLWPGGEAIGKRVRIMGGQEPWYRVVGVAGPVRDWGLEEPAAEIAYFPLVPLAGGPGWSPLRGVTVVARSETADPTSLMAPIRRIVAELDANVPISNVRTLSQVFDESMARATLAMVLIGIAAGVALLLGVVGIYGVISYVVSQRTAEVGLRIALGAEPGAVSRMVLGESMRLAVLGVVLGLAGALGLQRLMAAVLFGVRATDPAILSAASALLLLVALLACYVPARRAARVDPVVALRAE